MTESEAMAAELENEAEVDLEGGNPTQDTLEFFLDYINAAFPESNLNNRQYYINSRLLVWLKDNSTKMGHVLLKAD